MTTRTRIWCRYCRRVASTRHNMLCDTCAQDGRIRAMVRPYRGANSRAWETAYGISAVFCALDIFERDDWTCGVCGEWIDRDLGHPDPASACIDHIVPLPDGENTPENVRAAHLRCNIRRPRTKGDPDAPIRYLANHDPVIPQWWATDADPTATEGVDNVTDDLRRRGVQRALSALPFEERRVLLLRFGFCGLPQTLEEIGDALGRSRETIRQLEGQALARLAALRDLALATAPSTAADPVLAAQNSLLKARAEAELERLDRASHDLV